MKCGICGQEFERRCNNQRYCCKECSKVAKSNYLKEWKKRNPNYPKEWRKRNPNYHKEYRRANPECYVLNSIKHRCTNPNDASLDRYGGRGIEVRFNLCEFRQFYSRTNTCESCGRTFSRGKSSPSTKHIHRLDKSGHYEEGNCVLVCQSCHSKIHNGTLCLIIEKPIKTAA